MAVSSLRINQQTWVFDSLNEDALLFRPIGDNTLEKVHQLYRLIENSEILGVIDLVPAYESLTVFWDSSKTTSDEFVDSLRGFDSKVATFTPNTFHIKVDYSNGLDWGRVEKLTGLKRIEIIARHSSTTYKVAMIGFLPGFIFLDGLDPALTVPRLPVPRNKIPPGSIGIGGSQTGIYSLPSAGGWNIIGTTTDQFFDSNQDPPINIKPGDRVKLVVME